MRKGPERRPLCSGLGIMPPDVNRRVRWTRRADKSSLGLAEESESRQRTVFYAMKSLWVKCRPARAARPIFCVTPQRCPR
jgi:hypothetical protein